MGSLEITPSGSKDLKQVQKVAFCSSFSLQGTEARKSGGGGGVQGCSMQLNTLKFLTKSQDWENIFLNTQVNVCQSKQTFRAAGKLPAQGERSGVVGSRRGGFGA